MYKKLLKKLKNTKLIKYLFFLIVVSLSVVSMVLSVFFKRSNEDLSSLFLNVGIGILASLVVTVWSIINDKNLNLAIDNKKQIIAKMIDDEINVICSGSVNTNEFTESDDSLLYGNYEEFNYYANEFESLMSQKQEFDFISWDIIEHFKGCKTIQTIIENYKIEIKDIYVFLKRYTTSEELLFPPLFDDDEVIYPNDKKYKKLLDLEYDISLLPCKTISTISGNEINLNEYHNIHKHIVDFSKAISIYNHSLVCELKYLAAKV